MARQSRTGGIRELSEHVRPDLKIFRGIARRWRWQFGDRGGLSSAPERHSLSPSPPGEKDETYWVLKRCLRAPRADTFHIGRDASVLAIGGITERWPAPLIRRSPRASWSFPAEIAVFICRRCDRATNIAVMHDNFSTWHRRRLCASSSTGIADGISAIRTTTEGNAFGINMTGTGDDAQSRSIPAASGCHSNGTSVGTAASHDICDPVAVCDRCGRPGGRPARRLLPLV